jgi:hypothetical protein
MHSVNGQGVSACALRDDKTATSGEICRLGVQV